MKTIVDYATLEKGYVDNEVTTRATLGAHNLLPNTATTQVVNGVTWTVNDDGTVITSGTASTTSYLSDLSIPSSLRGKSVKLSGCPADGGYGKFRMVCLVDNADLASDEGNGATFTIPNNFTSCVVRILVYTGYGNGLTFKPMIRLASDTDSTYQPYAMTNRELTTSMLKTKLFGNIAIDSLTLAAGASGDVKKNAANISYDDLGLKAGSIKAVILTWSTGHVCVPTQIYASGGNNIILSLYNPSSSSVTVTQVDLQVFYTE